MHQLHVNCLIIIFFQLKPCLFKAFFAIIVIYRFYCLAYIPLLALFLVSIIDNIYKYVAKSRNIMISLWSLSQTQQNIICKHLLFCVNSTSKSYYLKLIYILKETKCNFQHKSLASSSALSLCRVNLSSQNWSVFLK